VTRWAGRNPRPYRDRFHEDHIHLDLVERKGSYKICQWNVLGSALAAARGAELPSLQSLILST